MRSTFPKVKRFHFSVSLRPHRIHLSVLEAKIFSKLCELATMKGGTIIRLYHLGYIIGRKFLVESKNHRSGRCRVDHLSFRRSWCPVTSQKSKLSFF